MKARIVLFAVVLAAPIACRAEWYEDQHFTDAELSTVACDVIRSPFTKMITGGLHLQGTPATGKLYVAMTRAEVQAIQPNSQVMGVREVERHKLTPAEGASLSGLFTQAADRGVPIYLQLAASIPYVPIAVGAGLTILDSLIRQYPNNVVHPAAIAEIVKSGGSIVRLLTIQNDADHHPWIGQHLVLETSINGQPKSYFLCSAQFALKVQ